jgi:hypothetical protein
MIESLRQKWPNGEFVWDRQRHPDTDELEPMLWFTRFERYRLAGVSRSLLSAYNQDRREKAEKNGTDFVSATSIPGSWDDAVELWDWKDRVEAFDVQQQIILRDEQEKLLTAVREQHLTLTRTLQAAGLKRLQVLLGQRTLRSVPAGEARKMVLEGIRMERELLGVENVVLREGETKVDVELGEDVVRIVHRGKSTPDSDS